MRKPVWQVLNEYKDGTSRCRCTNCGNTYRLSKYTVFGFKFCPKCGVKIQGIEEN